MSPVEAILAGLIAVQIIYQAWTKRAVVKSDNHVDIERLLDERWEREMKRMESEIQSLRLRVVILENHILRHGIPLPPMEGIDGLDLGTT